MTLQAIRNNSAHSFARFAAYSKERFQSVFDDLTDELGRTACLNMLVATEAELRHDYENRSRRRNKSEIGTRMKRLFKEHEQRIRFEEQLLEAWKSEFPLEAGKFSKLKGAFKYRHWLAHGRGWDSPLDDQYTPERVFEVCRDVLNMVRT